MPCGDDTSWGFTAGSHGKDTLGKTTYSVRSKGFLILSLDILCEALPYLVAVGYLTCRSAKWRPSANEYTSSTGTTPNNP